MQDAGGALSGDGFAWTLGEAVRAAADLADSTEVETATSAVASMLDAGRPSAVPSAIATYEEVCPRDGDPRDLSPLRAEIIGGASTMEVAEVCHEVQIFNNVVNGASPPGALAASTHARIAASAASVAGVEDVYSDLTALADFLETPDGEPLDPDYGRGLLTSVLSWCGEGGFPVRLP